MMVFVTFQLIYGKWRLTAMYSMLIFRLSKEVVSLERRCANNVNRLLSRRILIAEFTLMKSRLCKKSTRIYGSRSLICWKDFQR